MKITAGIYKGRKITAPDEELTRPTLSKTREAIFSVLFSLIDFKDKTFLDMFAGSGIMGLEAISRGFKRIVAIEKSPKVAKTLKDNYKSLRLEPNIFIKDSLKILAKLDEKFDVIYIDPPYFAGIYEKSLEQIQESKKLSDEGIVILEHVVDVDWGKYGFNILKQKSYSKKFITFLTSN